MGSLNIFFAIISFFLIEDKIVMLEFWYMSFVCHPIKSNVWLSKNIIISLSFSFIEKLMKVSSIIFSSRQIR